MLEVWLLDAYFGLEGPFLLATAGKNKATHLLIEYEGRL